MKENNNILHYIMAASAVILTFSVLYLIITTKQQVLVQPVMPQVQESVSPQFPQYPMGMEVTSNLSGIGLDSSIVNKENEEKVVSVVHKVIFNPELKKFVYTYKVTFNGKKNCFLFWEVLDRVIYGEVVSKPQTPHLIELIPGKTQEFKLESTTPPALYEGFAWLYIKKDGEIWEMQRLASQPAPLPSKNVQ